MWIISSCLAVLSMVSLKEPSWLDTMIAGYVCDSDESHRDVGVYDQRSGFYLVRTLECDGAFVDLLLTRDRKLVRDHGYAPATETTDESHRAVKTKKLPNLSTAKGLRIGDSEDRLRRILGRSYQFSREGESKQFDVFKFQWTEPGDDMPATYTQTYTFKAGKLIEVHFSRGAG